MSLLEWKIKALKLALVAGVITTVRNDQEVPSPPQALPQDTATPAATASNRDATQPDYSKLSIEVIEPERLSEEAKKWIKSKASPDTVIIFTNNHYEPGMLAAISHPKFLDDISSSDKKQRPIFALEYWHELEPDFIAAHKQGFPEVERLFEQYMNGGGREKDALRSSLAARLYEGLLQRDIKPVFMDTKPAENAYLQYAAKHGHEVADLETQSNSELLAAKQILVESRLKATKEWAERIRDSMHQGLHGPVYSLCGEAHAEILHKSLEDLGIKTQIIALRCGPGPSFEGPKTIDSQGVHYKADAIVVVPSNVSKDNIKLPLSSTERWHRRLEKLRSAIFSVPNDSKLTDVQKEQIMHCYISSKLDSDDDPDTAQSRLAKLNEELNKTNPNSSAVKLVKKADNLAQEELSLLNKTSKRAR